MFKDFKSPQLSGKNVPMINIMGDYGTNQQKKKFSIWKFILMMLTSIREIFYFLVPKARPDREQYSKPIPDEVLPVSKPYTVKIKNTTGEKKLAKLFGGHYLKDLPNFGSDEGIEISPSNNVSYAHLLNQSVSKPFDISLIRFNSADTVQLDAPLSVRVADANGRSAMDPVPLSTYKDAYQQQASIVDVKYPIYVDGNTSLEIMMLPNATLVLSIFPQQIFDPFRSQSKFNMDKSILVKSVQNENAIRKAITLMYLIFAFQFLHFIVDRYFNFTAEDVVSVLKAIGLYIFLPVVGIFIGYKIFELIYVSITHARLLRVQQERISNASYEYKQRHVQPTAENEKPAEQEVKEEKVPEPTSQPENSPTSETGPENNSTTASDDQPK